MHSSLRLKMPLELRASKPSNPVTSRIPVGAKVAYIEDITRWREDMNFIFEWRKQYFTHSLRSFVKYCFLPRRFLRYSEDFRPPSEDFRRFSKIVPNTRRTFPNIFREFPKITEDVRRLPKTSEEDPKMFRWYTNEFKYNLRDKPDVIERYDTLKGDIRKIRHSGPGWSGVWNLRVV